MFLNPWDQLASSVNSGKQMMSGGTILQVKIKESVPC